jgi:hypothetical protein
MRMKKLIFSEDILREEKEIFFKNAMSEFK